jgi:predicted CXXCH cytochrome family protein
MGRWRCDDLDCRRIDDSPNCIVSHVNHWPGGLKLKIFWQIPDWGIGAAVVVASIGAITVWCLRPESEIPRVVEGQRGLARDTVRVKDLAPRVDLRGEYAGSDSCQACHPRQHGSWQTTYHRTMTQHATPESVVGNFDDVQLQSRGRTFHLQRRGDQFWVTMPDPDVESQMQFDGYDLSQISDEEMPKTTRPVVMTTGSHHYQGYWVKSATLGNHLQSFPWFFLIDEQRWVPREDVFLAQPGTYRHFKTWNDSCIQCHSTGGWPGFDAETYQFETTVVEFGISCEACHGPAAAHVEYQRSTTTDSKQTDSQDDKTIVNPAKLPHDVSAEVCGQCHSSFNMDMESYLADGRPFRPGMRMDESYYTRFHDGVREGTDEALSSEYYWRDGACRVGGREYLGLLESSCFQHGTMSCLSCHSLHESDPDDQLAERMDGNHACLQCHETIGNDLEGHTHHPADSSGSRCYNCHMPHTAFALMKAIRSHRVDSPNVRSTARSGRPGACNLCHLDKTLKWTAEHLSQWYGHDPVKLTSAQEETAASLLWMLGGDAVQRSITAWHMGWPEATATSGTWWQAPFLARLLDDKYSVVRIVAGRSLNRLPEYENYQYDFLAEPAERTAAARQVIDQWLLTAREGVVDSESLLIGPSGQLLAEEIDRLVKQGQDTPDLYHPE